MLSHQQMKSAEQKASRVKRVYVYQAPIRIWHWVTVSSMLVLICTGYFIGTPFLEQPGHDEDMFFMGYIRFAHFAAGYIFAIAFLARVYWAIVGNEHARQLFMPPVFKSEWWSEVIFEFRWYFFLEDRPKKYVGHNPLALGMMFFVFVLSSLFMIFSGFAMYSEAMGEDHWSSILFGWVNSLLGGSLMTHSLHRLVMWYIICFIIVHVYAAIREDIMSRQSILSSMVNGWRTFKD